MRLENKRTATMTTDADIRIHHMTRVEGHADIRVRIENGALDHVEFSVVEAPRFFEAFLRGKHFADVTHIVSRICGICAVSHRCAAVTATEAAFGVEVSEQTKLLRRLALNGEALSSHILHLYFLCAPDYMETTDAFSLDARHPETLERAMRLKRLGYDLCAAVGGRHTHPTAMVPGGFTFVHAEKSLWELHDRLNAAMEDIDAATALFKTFTPPAFERETEYVSLSHPERYAFDDGALCSSEGPRVSPSHYREQITEIVQPHSTALYARWRRSEYMVGALARINNNYERLSSLGKEAASALGIDSPCHNPFFNLFAQLAECAHCVEDSLKLIERICRKGVRASDELVDVRPKSGRGVGAVEAPRGTLLHDYEYDADGRCLNVNLIVPTAQNLANLEADMRTFVPLILSETRSAIALRLEMLARAYDPCISCSVH